MPRRVGPCAALRPVAPGPATVSVTRAGTHGPRPVLARRRDVGDVDRRVADVVSVSGFAIRRSAMGSTHPFGLGPLASVLFQIGDEHALPQLVEAGVNPELSSDVQQTDRPRRVDRPAAAYWGSFIDAVDALVCVARDLGRASRPERTAATGPGAGRPYGMYAPAVSVPRAAAVLSVLPHCVFQPSAPGSAVATAGTSRSACRGMWRRTRIAGDAPS